MTKPLLFLGSSSEGLPIAEIIGGHLERDFSVQFWRAGLFVPGQYPLESLDVAIRKCMFAVIVGTDDDVLTKRKVVAPTVRDNLVFELGLFLGVLGRRRALLVTPQGSDLALPTDLEGLTRPTYRPCPGPPTTREWIESLSRASVEIADALLAEVGRERREQEAVRAATLKDDRRQAVARLNRAVTQLRDLFIELPTNALAALGDKDKFDKVKSDAGARVREMEAEWQRDAKMLGVTSQMETLVFRTCRAIEAFPYPAIHVSKQEGIDVARRLAARAGQGRGFNEMFEGAAEQVGEEVARKSEEFAKMYRDWWAGQVAELRQAAYLLQDALMAAALEP